MPGLLATCRVQNSCLRFLLPLFLQPHQNTNSICLYLTHQKVSHLPLVFVLSSKYIFFKYLSHLKILIPKILNEKTVLLSRNSNPKSNCLGKRRGERGIILVKTSGGKGRKDCRISCVSCETLPWVEALGRRWSISRIGQTFSVHHYRGKKLSPRHQDTLT